MHARLVGSIVSLALLLTLARPARADPAAYSWSVGTSAWMVRNLFPDSADFYYLELEHAFDEHHSLIVEPLTWTYHAPTAIPWVSSHYGDPAEDYPGFVRSVGVGLGYRYDVWRGLNASIRSINFLQIYSEDDRPRKTGFQLFLQTRVGWRVAPWKSGPWIEPSVAFNWWPVEVGRPASFVAKDEKWPSHFLFEPWVNLGWRW